MGRKDDDYQFLRLTDAVSAINQKVNLIGVVTETSIPKQSKGTDCFCTIRMVDESKQSPGIPVNFFAETMDRLPQAQSVGDIIVLSRVVMKNHGSEAYAVYNKKFSSFALFDGKHGSSFRPYQFSSKYNPRDEDKKLIVDLREFLLKHPSETGSCGSQSLREISTGDRFTLTCKILYLSEVNKDELILFVWDGTDTPPLVIETNRLEDETNPLPLQFKSSAMPRDILCTFPAVGTVLRVIISRANEKLGLNIIKPGRWVKLASLKCEIHDSLWCAYLMPFTRVCYLRDDDDLVLQRQRNYNERVSSKWGRMPLSCFPWPVDLTEAGHTDVPFVTLMNVLTHPEVTAKFRCVVRVIGVIPWKSKDFRCPLGTYRIRLTIEDPTARLHAYLYADDAEVFFGGYRPADELTKMRDALLGIPESHNDSETGVKPPWIQCCLKSYYTDKADQWGSRCYRIFATTMSGHFS